jgi:hypothetical protein
VPDSDDENPDVIEMAPRFGGNPSATEDAANPARPPKARNRRVLAAGAAVAVAIALAVFAGLASSSALHANPANSALAKLITEVTTVPENMSVAVTVGPGFPLPTPTPIPMPAPVAGAPLREHGKPEVFYVAAEYCPYCGVENWPLIVALSRFGRFSGLATVRSADYPPFPPLDTWTFYGSSYTSRYLAFVPFELRSNVLVSARDNPLGGGNYRELQKLTAAQQAILDEHDQTRAIPFMDFGNRVVQVGSAFSPTVLEQLTWDQIAATLRDPNSPVGQAILSAADSITAVICQLTGDRPARACPPAVHSLQVGP